MLEELLNDLNMGGNGSPLYEAQWNEVKAETSLYFGDMGSVIKYTRQELKEYKKFYVDQIVWEILDAEEAIKTSFPSFKKVIKKLGGKIN